jgi:hypothetical protein
MIKILISNFGIAWGSFGLSPALCLSAVALIGLLRGHVDFGQD